ncbi:MAG: DUF4389 domain-containing protein [Dehalococcoidia bacterium]|nr:DUF4389 domain-containing protein [Dehalococcoidia bacterium]
MSQAAAPYPVQFLVDYPDRPLDRFSTFFRILAVIPIALVYYLVGGNWSNGDYQYYLTAGGALFLPPLLLILFRQKYPRWWFDWNVALYKFGARVGTYLSLLRDEYPATDEEQAIHIEIPYPNVSVDLNRWLPLFKWLFAFPHYVVLVFLVIAALVSVVIAWFAILFTGRYPRGLFDFVVGVNRWFIRVSAYAFLLTTDRYPPFRLSP